MAQRMTPVTLFQGQLISGLAASSVALTSGIQLVQDVMSARSIVFQASSVTSLVDVSIQYAVSPDGLTFGSHSDQAPLLASTKSYALTSAGWYTLSLPASFHNAGYVRIAVSGVASNPTDARVWATLWLVQS